MPILVRFEKSSDIEAITSLIKSLFYKVKYSNHAEHFIVNALRETSELTFSLVAIDSEVLIGHVAVSPVTISSPTGNWFGLGPVSVASAYQRQGIGSRLVSSALGALKHSGTSGCVVLRDPAYYGRFGFKPFPGLVLPGVPPQYFQALTLQGDLPYGEVAYSAAFNATA